MGSGDAGPEWSGRVRFFGAAAQAMRCLPVKNAPCGLAPSRGAGAERVPFEEFDLAIHAAVGASRWGMRRGTGWRRRTPRPRNW